MVSVSFPNEENVAVCAPEADQRKTDTVFNVIQSFNHYSLGNWQQSLKQTDKRLIYCKAVF